MTTEKNLWLRVKKNLPHDCYATRIENRMDGGIPDVHVIWNGLPFWIELKLTKANKIRLSPNQIAWNTKYSLNNGLAYILVQRVGEGSLFLFRGDDARELAIDGLNTEPIIKVSGSGFGDIFGAIRESGIKHLETVIKKHKQGD
jgi:Holliday junction resolvase